MKQTIIIPIINSENKKNDDKKKQIKATLFRLVFYFLLLSFSFCYLFLSTTMNDVRLSLILVSIFVIVVGYQATKYKKLKTS